MQSASPSAGKKKWTAIVLVIIALVLLVLVWRQTERAPSTDDAYAYADKIDIVAEVPGRIIEMPVRDNQAVKKGDLLMRIDPRPFEDDLARSKAAMAALDAQIALMQRAVNAQKFNAKSVLAVSEKAKAAAALTAQTLRRTEPLLAPGYVSAEDVDRARTANAAAQADLNAAQLQVQQAVEAVGSVDALVAQRGVVEAEMSLARHRLEMATVRAPFDGRIVSLKTTVGQFATTLKPVFTLIDTEHWYVVANFRETELKGIRAGTPATVYLMADTGKRFRGTVESVGYGVLPDDGGLVLDGLPRVQRSLNWVHVSQRFPVRIRVEKPDNELFRVGASAMTRLELDGGSAAK
jgi:membrane fusion protein, multidrug efflux system